jgi:8-oxo-dGTP pyrophosphatase MutT (NUDIX family)/phosphohistidine phosphatase SixA
VPDPVRAAGAVVWRDGPAGPEVALVHRPRYDDWSLPKGKLAQGETEAQAAVREVVEETGLRGPLGRGLGSTSYDVGVAGGIARKTVRWWALRADEGSFEPSDEVDELKWLSPAAALEVLAGSSEQEPLRRFADGPADAATVLLVRHASAGSRDDFDGPDDLRPLDDRGRRQAAALAEVLPLWRPQRVVSAPPLRCLQTVQPLGHDVEIDPCFGERHWDLPATLAALHRVAAGGSAVVCSQGGAIPALVSTLTRREDVRARKGSTWLLTLDGGALVDADHLDPPG